MFHGGQGLFIERGPESKRRIHTTKQTTHHDCDLILLCKFHVLVHIHCPKLRTNWAWVIKIELTPVHT